MFLHIESVIFAGIWTPGGVQSVLGAGGPPITTGEVFTPSPLPGEIYGAGRYSGMDLAARSHMPTADAIHVPNALRPQMRSCSMGGELSSPASELISGVGVLTWLSSKAGLITAKANKFTVSFQLKDFCDQGVSDLTAVLRPGFTLSFQALSSESNDWIATNVSPLHGLESEKEFFGAAEVDLEAAAASLSCGPPRLAKDMYSTDLELKAIPMLLSIFQRHGLPHCQLSSLHSQISNCGDEELYRYVGTSSLKRRQYLERRTHLFVMTSGDQVYLQAGGIYQAVVLLARYLLRRGGVTSTQSLYDYFTSCPEILIEAREMIGDGRGAFLSLIISHPWIFALFPARNFVSIRRNLPHYDYCAFLNQLVAASRPLNRVPPSGMTTGACWSAMAASGATGGPGGAPPSFVEPRVDGTTVGDAPSSSLLISWPLAAAAAAVCNAVQPTQRTTSPPYWSRQHGNTMMGVGGGFMEKQHKMSMVTTATQTDQVLKVDSCCGTDDDMKTRCYACGGSSATNLAGVEVSISTNPAYLPAHDEDVAEYAKQSNEERLYNPFHSFMPCDLTTTTGRFSALNL
uniref:Lin-66-like winged helix domain-containing protein n=1 Tax=Ascaris lumbricoides TaxID=6252 RepID=A0A9J2P4Y5_ASCLU